MNIDDLKQKINGFFSRAASIAQDAPDRTMNLVDNLEANGIIPNKAFVDSQGRIIPPVFVWWAPWMFRSILIFTALIVGTILKTIGDNSGVAFSDVAILIPFVMGIVIYYIRNVNSWISGIAAVAIFTIAAYVISRGVLITLATLVFLSLTVFIEHMYARAVFDYCAVDSFEEIKQSLSAYGTAYELEEREGTDINGETLTTISDIETGQPKRALIRHLPDNVSEGWLIAVDPARRFMAGLSPEQRIRVQEIQAES